MTRVGAHNQLIYFPRESNCPVCSEAVVQKASCAANPLVEQDTLPPAVALADRVSADHVILNDDDKARSADQVEMVIRDKFTKWSQACPAPSKSHQECVKAVQRFLPPFVKAERVYTDNSGELAKAVSELPLSHDKCMHSSQTLCKRSCRKGCTKSQRRHISVNVPSRTQRRLVASSHTVLLLPKKRGG